MLSHQSKIVVFRRMQDHDHAERRPVRVELKGRVRPALKGIVVFKKCHDSEGMIGTAAKRPTFGIEPNGLGRRHFCFIIFALYGKRMGEHVGIVGIQFVAMVNVPRGGVDTG